LYRKREGARRLHEHGVFARFRYNDLKEAAVIAADAGLWVPASLGTAVSLTASDANVQIPGSVTIPAGQLSLEVPFSVAAAMPVNHWFSISAQSNGTTAIAYNFVPASGSIAPFLLNVFGGLPQLTNSPHPVLVKPLSGPPT
jgi:hypothetical protein